jgi:leader peptidase (prepilin peptidase)/N-methyltransferase
MASLFLFIIIFVLGLTVGSFLNCLIYRLTLPSFSLKNLGGLKNRSFCPHCKHTLSWPDLIPIFSFIILRGRCRYCHQKISWQYPLIELTTGILFVLIWMKFFAMVNFINIFFYLLISCFLIIIFVYDLKHYIIPDKIIYLAIVIAFFYQLFKNLEFGIQKWELENLASPFLSAFLASAFFLLIVLISQGKWMGLGDVKLVFFLGLFLGWPNILVALFLAFFVGAIVGLILIALGIKSLKSEVPFGPFLVSGTFLAIFFGQQLINRYLSLFS